MDNDEQGWTVVSTKKPRKPKPLRGEVSENYDQAEQYPSFGGNPNQDWKEIRFYKRKSPPKEMVSRSNVMTDEQKRLAKIADAEDVGKLKKVKPELSKKIQDYRRVHKLTQAQLAQMLNIRVEVVNSYEKGTAQHEPSITNKFNQLMNRKSTKEENK